MTFLWSVNNWHDLWKDRISMLCWATKSMESLDPWYDMWRDMVCWVTQSMSAVVYTVTLASPYLYRGSVGRTLAALSLGRATMVSGCPSCRPSGRPCRLVAMERSRACWGGKACRANVFGSVATYMPTSLVTWGVIPNRRHQPSADHWYIRE